MSEDQFMGNLYQRFPVTIEKGKGLMYGMLMEKNTLIVWEDMVLH